MAACWVCEKGAVLMEPRDRCLTEIRSRSRADYPYGVQHGWYSKGGFKKLRPAMNLA